MSDLHTGRNVSVAQIIANCQVLKVAAERLLRFVVILEAMK